MIVMEGVQKKMLLGWSAIKVLNCSVVNSTKRNFSTFGMQCQKKDKFPSDQPVIVKVHTEMKELYGPLLRTSRDKQKMLKKEAKARKTTPAIPKEKPQITVIESGFKTIGSINLSKSQNSKIEKAFNETVNKPRIISVQYLDENKLVKRFTFEQQKPPQETIPNSPNGTKSNAQQPLEFPMISVENTGLLKVKARSIVDEENKLPLEEEQEVTELISNSGAYVGKRSELKSHFPSVTTVLQKTMSPESQLALEKWKRSMIDKLGPDGFNTYQEEMYRTGKCLHKSIQDLLSGTTLPDVQVDPSCQGHWLSLAKVLAQVNQPALIEAKTYHPLLRYSGIVDAVATYKERPVLIEWKSSQKQKSSIDHTYDNPVQAVAYLGALNYDPNHKLNLENAMVVIAYPSGEPANVHFMNRETCDRYWGIWLGRLKLYWSKRIKEESL